MMKHVHQDIPGWFDFEGIYSAHVTAAKAGAHFVEVGTLFGKSAMYMAVEIVNSGKAIRFDTIDNFEGVTRDQVSPSDWLWYERAVGEHGGLKLAAEYFLSPLRSIANLRVGNSLKMADTYPDASLDFVYLDDNHTGAHVAAELRAWWQKVKMGGTLAGHDLDFPEVAAAVDEFAAWLTGAGHRVMVQRLGRSWGLKKEEPKKAVNGAPYPAVRYHAEHGERLVRSADEERALGAGWSNKPGGVVEVAPEAPPDAPEAASDAPDPSPDAPEAATEAPKARIGKKGGRR
jgi:Methyltransferase domain